MIGVLLDYGSWVLLAAGAFLGFSGAIGLLRFPDFYTRIHAASVTDTLCVGFITAGLALQGADILMILKLGIILFTLSYTGPTAAHALAKAALYSGLAPWKRGEQEEGGK